MRKKDISGIKFGRLLAVKLDHVKRTADKAEPYWECLCDCGKTHVVRKYGLTSGRTQSCGCLKAEVISRYKFKAGVGLVGAYKHGLKHSTVYKSWVCMISRCTHPTNPKYKNYGGRGITVCPEWFDLKVFLRDMGEKPFKGAQIDRIDNNKGYFKDNCRWTTAAENNRNRRNNHLVTHKGQTKTLAEWAELTGIGRNRIVRAERLGIIEPLFSSSSVNG